ncbi:MAG: AAA family ATPase [Nitratiruptor sp.]|nr:AAA family ATPase [Nitratiruptor sp.]NPA83237.1 ATP-dependent metallopeptidase FtsH/Yme1/Tma family protein [Campylobacterota bacterium]
MWPSFRKRLAILLGSVAILVLLIAIYLVKEGAPPTLDYKTYQSLLENNLIDEAIITQDSIILRSANQHFQIPKELIDLPELYAKVPVHMARDYSFLYDIVTILILAFFVGYVIFYLRRQKQEPIPIHHQIQIAPANEMEDHSFDIHPQVSSVLFDDVAGIDEVKEELEEIIDFLKDPKRYTSFGVRMPKGVLLVGPPGVGKTLIAKAVAGEAGVPFFYQSGSAFVQIYVGMGAKRVRELFKKAKEMAPSIIFIDEIDAVGKARGGMRNDEREATLNQLLTEMDGFEESSEVIVIGATNKIEILDEALLRPGRFDRRIFVGLPNRADRAKILQIYLRPIPHRVDIQRLAQMTVGFSGAALSSLVNEAALHALRRGAKYVEMVDFEAVREKVIYGKRKVLSLSQKEKEVQAIYQAAKALSAYWYDQEFEKLGLIGGQIKEVDKEILSKHDFLAKIKVLLAGYVALRLLVGEEFSIGAEDIRKAKLLAEEMVVRYGMGGRLFGDGEDVARIIEESLEELREFLGRKRKVLNHLVRKLLEEEFITREDVKRALDAVF